MLFLPKYLGVNGVWLVVPFAEITTLSISSYFIYKYRNEYLYSNIFFSKRFIKVD